MRGLAGKVGIIAGAARGIGAATAERLCEEGVKLVIADIMEDNVKATADRIDGDVIGVHLDGTEPASQEALIAKTLETYGRLNFYHSNLDQCGRHHRRGAG